jgi:HSP20 family molecular chaperone IbpA
VARESCRTEPAAGDRFRVPKDVDEDAITTRYENGVLEVTLPAIPDSTASGTTIPIEG